MDNTLIKSATALLLHDALEDLNDVATKHGRENDKEYTDNMLLISMIGYAIATGRDKRYIVEMFGNIVKDQQDENAMEVINQAKSYL